METSDFKLDGDIDLVLVRGDIGPNLLFLILAVSYLKKVHLLNWLSNGPHNLMLLINSVFYEFREEYIHSTDDI